MPSCALLGIAASMVAAASCTCSGDAPAAGVGSAPSASASPSAVVSGSAVASPTGSQVAPPPPPRPALLEESAELDNGLHLELLTGPCGDSVAIAVLIAGGIDHDPPGRSGMAQLASRVLASVAGGDPRVVEVGDEYTLYSVVTSPQGLAAELDAVAAWMVKKPSSEEVAKQRKALLGELSKLSGADAKATAMSIAEESQAPARGDGKRRGVAAEVEAMTTKELQAHWAELFKPGNARVVIAGAFDAKKARAASDAAFAKLPAGTAPTARPETVSSVAGTLVMGDAPTAVAIAVPVPAPGDPLYAPFLVLAERLLAKTAPGGAWEVAYDPLRRPDLLLVTGAVTPPEQAEPAAARIRAAVAAAIAGAPTAEDVTRVKERFRFVVEPTLLEPGWCAKDPRGFAIARARRAQLELDAAPVAKGLGALTAEQLEKAAQLFGAKRSAAVIAGGKLQ